MIQIQVNGQLVTFNASLSILDLANYYKLTLTDVVIEHNGVILNHIKWEKTICLDGDVIEIIHYIGGGTKVL